MLGEQFMVGEEICGAVVSVRFQVSACENWHVWQGCKKCPVLTPSSRAVVQEDIISIWNKTASDQATTARIRDTLRRVLNLPPNTIMEYKTHTDSIKYVCWPGGCCRLHACSSGSVHGAGVGRSARVR